MMLASRSNGAGASDHQNGFHGGDKFMRQHQFVEFFNQRFFWREIEENENQLNRLFDILTQNLLEMISIESGGDQIERSRLDSSKRCLKFLNGFFSETHIFPNETIMDELLILIPTIHFDSVETSKQILDFFEFALVWFSDRPKLVASFEECKKALLFRIIKLKWILNKEKQKTIQQQNASLFDSLYSVWSKIDSPSSLTTNTSWKISNSLIPNLLTEEKLDSIDDYSSFNEWKDTMMNISSISVNIVLFYLDLFLSFSTSMEKTKNNSQIVVAIDKANKAMNEKRPENWQFLFSMLEKIPKQSFSIQSILELFRGLFSLSVFWPMTNDAFSKSSPIEILKKCLISFVDFENSNFRNDEILFFDSGWASFPSLFDDLLLKIISPQTTEEIILLQPPTTDVSLKSEKLLNLFAKLLFNWLRGLFVPNKEHLNLLLNTLIVNPEPFTTMEMNNQQALQNRQKFLIFCVLYAIYSTVLPFEIQTREHRLWDIVQKEFLDWKESDEKLKRDFIQLLASIHSINRQLVRNQYDLKLKEFGQFIVEKLDSLFSILPKEKSIPDVINFLINICQRWKFMVDFGLFETDLKILYSLINFLTPQIKYLRDSGNNALLLALFSLVDKMMKLVTSHRLKFSVIDVIRNIPKFVSNIATSILFSFVSENLGIYDKQQLSLYEISISCVCWFNVNGADIELFRSKNTQIICKTRLIPFFVLSRDLSASLQQNEITQKSLMLRLFFESELFWQTSFITVENFNALTALNSFRSIIGEAQFQNVSTSLSLNSTYSNRLVCLKGIFSTFNRPETVLNELKHMLEIGKDKNVDSKHIDFLFAVGFTFLSKPRMLSDIRSADMLRLILMGKIGNFVLTNGIKYITPTIWLLSMSNVSFDDTVLTDLIYDLVDSNLPIQQEKSLFLVSGLVGPLNNNTNNNNSEIDFIDVQAFDFGKLSNFRRRIMSNVISLALFHFKIRHYSYAKNCLQLISSVLDSVASTDLNCGDFLAEFGTVLVPIVSLFQDVNSFPSQSDSKVLILKSCFYTLFRSYVRNLNSFVRGDQEQLFSFEFKLPASHLKALPNNNNAMPVSNPFNSTQTSTTNTTQSSGDNNVLENLSSSLFPETTVASFFRWLANQAVNDVVCWIDVNMSQPEHQQLKTRMQQSSFLSFRHLKSKLENLEPNLPQNSRFGKFPGVQTTLPAPKIEEIVKEIFALLIDLSQLTPRLSIWVQTLIDFVDPLFQLSIRREETLRICKIWREFVQKTRER